MTIQHRRTEFIPFPNDCNGMNSVLPHSAYYKTPNPQLVVFGNDVDPAPFAVELYSAVDQSKEGVVLPLADAATWVELGTDLPDENIADANLLSSESLHAAHLRIGIATVAAGALTFLMSHRSTCKK